MGNTLDEFIAKYQADDNEWWYLSRGEMQNHFDELLEQYQKLQASVSETVDKLIEERNAARALVGALETACIEARRWIEHNDDASDNDSGRVLQLIRDAL